MPAPPPTPAPTRAFAAARHAWAWALAAHLRAGGAAAQGGIPYVPSAPGPSSPVHTPNASMQAMRRSSEKLGASLLEIVSLVQQGILILALFALVAYVFALYAGRADGMRLVSILSCLVLAFLATSLTEHFLLPAGTTVESLAGSEAPWGGR